MQSDAHVASGISVAQCYVAYELGPDPGAISPLVINQGMRFSRRTDDVFAFMVRHDHAAAFPTAH